MGVHEDSLKLLELAVKANHDQLSPEEAREFARLSNDEGQRSYIEEMKRVVESRPTPSMIDEPSTWALLIATVLLFLSQAMSLWGPR